MNWPDCCNILKEDRNMNSVTIFGIGGIGGYLGAVIGSRLPALDLTFIARGKHLEAIRNQGLTFRRDGHSDTLARPARAVDSSGNLGVQDLIFICVKAYDLEQACREIEELVDDHTVIIPVLNGMDIHTRIRKFLKKGILLSGATYVSSYIEKPGVIRFQTGREVFVLGKSPDCQDFNPSGLLAFLENAGVPFQWFDDPRPAIWRKYLFISPYSLMGAWSGKTMGAVLADPQLNSMVQTLQQEVYAVGLASGVNLTEDDVLDAQAFARGLNYECTTSFQRDFIDPSRKNELDLYGSAVVRLGHSLDVPTPQMERISRDLEKKREG